MQIDLLECYSFITDKAEEYYMQYVIYVYVDPEMREELERNGLYEEFPHHAEVEFAVPINLN